MMIRLPERTPAGVGAEVNEPEFSRHGGDVGMGGRQIGANLGPRRLDRDDAGRDSLLDIVTPRSVLSNEFLLYWPRGDSNSHVLPDIGS